MISYILKVGQSITWIYEVLLKESYLSLMRKIMKIHRLQFSIEIHAEKTRIWNALWKDSSYREWASVFFEGSYIVVNNWEEGSTVHFLAPDQSGIYSRIETHIPNTMIRFTHIGNVLEGKEQAIDEETKT